MKPTALYGSSRDGRCYHQDTAAREGDSSSAVDPDSDTTDAGDEVDFPFGSYPRAQCQAVVAKGMLCCLRCKAPRTDFANFTKMFFENQKFRKRLLATAAAGSSKPTEGLITTDLRHLNQGAKKRGQLSAEATVIRDAQGSCDKGDEAACHIRVNSLGGE